MWWEENRVEKLSWLNGKVLLRKGCFLRKCTNIRFISKMFIFESDFHIYRVKTFQRPKDVFLFTLVSSQLSFEKVPVSWLFSGMAMDAKSLSDDLWGSSSVVSSLQGGLPRP